MARIILIGGGSSSGKSYVTRNVIKNVGADFVTRITLDDYYLDQKNVPMEERIKVNYDHPKAFDWTLMRSQIKDLKNDKPIRKPTYDFVNHTRSDVYEDIVPKKLVVVEGIMALTDKQLRDMADLRIFINASAERRFLRRLIRDRKERGRTFESIVNQYFSTVQPMYDEIIEPSSTYSDMIINNDGVKNLAIEVLTCLFRDELIKANQGINRTNPMDDEFTEETLNSAFQDAKNSK